MEPEPGPGSGSNPNQKRLILPSVVVGTTYYVRDASGTVVSIYERSKATNDELVLAEVPMYGANRVGTRTLVTPPMENTSPPITAEYEDRFELTDHLGNARVIFRRPTDANRLATMEESQATRENTEWANLDATRLPVGDNLAHSGKYVAQLATGVGRVSGPATSLAVEKGDTIAFSAWALLIPIGSRPSRLAITAGATAGAIPLTLSHAAIVGLGNAPTEPHRHSFNLLTPFTLSLGLGLNAQKVDPGDDIPFVPPGCLEGAAAWLHYVLRDSSGQSITEEYLPVPQNAIGGWWQMRLGIRVPEAGTLTCDIAGVALKHTVLFDDIATWQQTGMIVQEQHLYPYGSPINGLNYMLGVKPYRQGYQGAFAEKDRETDWNSFEERMYSARTGRWLSTDRVDHFNSPYVGMGNNPGLYADPDGRDVIILLDKWGANGAGHMALLVSQYNSEGQIVGWKFYNMAGAESGWLKGPVAQSSVLGEDYKSVADFVSHTKRYKDMYYIETTSSQESADEINAAAAALIGYIDENGVRIIDGYYHFSNNSCADDVTAALSAAGKNGGSSNLPRVRYNQIKRLNPNGKTLSSSALLGNAKGLGSMIRGVTNLFKSVGGIPIRTPRYSL